jgi:hypothetical protein
MIYIHALRIILQTTPAANASIGLYSGGEIRLSEIDLSSYSPTIAYTSGLLPVDFCGDISESIDLEQSGGVARVDGTTIKLSNTVSVSGAQTQLDEILRESDIYLSGCSVQVIRFEIVSGALVDADGTVLFRGILGDPTWDEMTMEIPAENAYYTRIANLTQYVDSVLSSDVSAVTTGNVVPVTFGKHNYAKFVRVSDKIQYLTNEEIYAYITGTVAPSYYSTEKILPVIYEADAPDHVSILLDNLAPPFDIWGVVFNLTGIYFVVVDGYKSGLIRGIDSASLIFALAATDTGGTDLTLNFSWFTDVALSANGSSVEKPLSWVRLFLSNRDYLGDTQPCFGPVDSNGNFVEKNAAIFVYDSNEKEVSKIGSYAYDLVTTDANNNKINLNPQLCESSIDDLATFTIFPAEGIAAYSGSSLSKFNFDDYKKIQDGLFKFNNYAFETASVLLTNTGSALDKDISTFATFSVEDTEFNKSGHTTKHCLAIDIDLPVIDDDLSFDECYLAINFYSECRPRAFNYKPFSGGASLKIFKRRFYGDATNINGDFPTYGDGYYDIYSSPKLSGSVVNSVPDFYYNTSDNTKNENFFRDPILTEDIGTLENRYEKISNHQYFKIDGIANADSYNSLSKITLLFFRNFTNGGSSTPANSLTDFVKIYEVGVAFRQKKTIKSDFYVNFHGRVFNDTWGTRKTATEVIETAPDIAEHLLRKQNWTDNSDTPLIDTTSFDSTTLDELKTIPLRSQIIDYNSAFTNKAIEDIARQHFLAFTQDPATGSERVSLFIGKPAETPATTISLSKIIPNSIRAVEQTRTRYVYAEPYIRYNKNFASGEFDAMIRITNSHQAVYNANYVSGITGDRAEKLWNKAHILWNAVKKIEVPPSNLTDHEWIYTEEGAYWYLDNWLSWMGAVDSETGYVFDPKRRIELSVPYEIGKDFALMDWVLLQLPHQTNNEGLPARIERYRKAVIKGKEQVDVRLIVYGTTDEVNRIIQDVYTGDIWQDVYTATDIVQDVKLL